VTPGNPRKTGLAWLAVFGALALGTAGVWAAGGAKALVGVEPPALGDGDGGAAALSAEELKALRAGREALWEYLANPGESPQDRAAAAEALARVHVALNDWGRAGQLDSYTELLVAANDRRLRAELLWGALSAAKARRRHLGGMRAFWRAVQPRLAARGGDAPRLVSDVRRHFSRIRLMSQPGSAQAAAIAVQERPMILRPPNLDLTRRRDLERMRLTFRGLDIARYLRPLPPDKPKKD
jgi:hypothetical protein